MECPFELPIGEPFESRDYQYSMTDGKGVFRIIIKGSKTHADYARKAINCHEKFKTALENIADLETDCCQRCEGNGRLYADGKLHLMSENAETILCGNCGGSGRTLSEDAQIIASEAIKEAEKK